jgi:hypothetical protein
MYRNWVLNWEIWPTFSAIDRIKSTQWDVRNWWCSPGKWFQFLSTMSQNQKSLFRIPLWISFCWAMWGKISWMSSSEGILFISWSKVTRRISFGRLGVLKVFRRISLSKLLVSIMKCTKMENWASILLIWIWLSTSKKSILMIFMKIDRLVNWESLTTRRPKS